MMDKGHACSFFGVASIGNFSCAIVVVSLMLVRILYTTYWSSRPLSRRAVKPVSTLIILGSGGHTAEMLNLLAVLQKDWFTPRFYIAAATDNMSLEKAQLLENSLAAEVLFLLVLRSPFDLMNSVAVILFLSILDNSIFWVGRIGVVKDIIPGYHAQCLEFNRIADYKLQLIVGAAFLCCNIWINLLMVYVYVTDLMSCDAVGD